MTAMYGGMEFGTALEARWAAFFDLAGWTWRCNPAPVADWKPDFHVTFPCDHSECGGSHSLLVSILAISDMQASGGHPALGYAYGARSFSNISIGADAGALFGTDPSVTYWEMSHGAGGGVSDVTQWVHDALALWDTASERVKRLSPMEPLNIPGKVISANHDGCLATIGPVGASMTTAALQTLVDAVQEIERKGDRLSAMVCPNTHPGNDWTAIGLINRGESYSLNLRGVCWEASRDEVLEFVRDAAIPFLARGATTRLLVRMERGG